MTHIHASSLPAKWRAGMAWCPDIPRDNGGARCFLRRAFDIDSVPASARAFVTADSRYRLYLNGSPLGRGPLKGTLAHYFFEEYELAPLLRRGRNVLAADVVWFGHQTPLSEEHSGFAGFLLQGPEEWGIDTPGAWKARSDSSTTWDRTPYTSNAHIFLAGMERVDGRSFPSGWERPDFDDSSWPTAAFAAPIDAPGGDPDRGLIWTLRPAETPALVEEPRRFVEARVGAGVAAAGWTLGPGEGGEIVLDAGALTTGFPTLAFSGGAGRTVELVYAECVLKRTDYKPDDDSPYLWGGGGRLRKGIRDDRSVADAVFHGYQDTVILPGDDFSYEPHHWRTFWYLVVRVPPGDTEFVLRDAAYRFTTYPQEQKASFDAPPDAPDVAKMWDISWRTLQLCSHETYEDCPGYEQLNYLLDARNEALISLAVAGEADLPRRTIRLFRDTLRPDGMLASRTPSQKGQTIPIFALWWVRMLLDYWDWVGERDAAFVHECLYAADGVLGYFRARLRADGFVGELPYWNPVGGEDAPGTDLDPAIRAGGSTYVTALYLMAVNAALRLHAEAGHPEDAARWRGVRKRLIGAVRSAWSPARGVFAERTSHPDEPVSQHTQAMAILTGAATGSQARRVVRSLEAGVPAARMTRQQGLPFAEAMYAAGRYDLAARQYLSEYRRQMDLGLTTWLEGRENGRSDCHAWSAWLPVELLRSVLGIRPARPGFAEIEIAPAAPVFSQASGTMPTPAGEVRVAWRREERGFSLEADAPPGVPVLIRLPDGTTHTFPRGGSGLHAEGRVP